MEFGAAESLSEAYDKGTFGMSRRTFTQLAMAAGITAVGGALVFPSKQAHAGFTEPAQSQWPTLEDGKIRFTVHSDTHVGADPENNYAKKIPLAFTSMYELAPDVVAHFFVGDSANNGTPEQYDELAAILNENAQAPIGIVMGNHEYYYHQYDETAAQEEFRTFLLDKLAVDGSFQIPGGPNEGEIDCDFVIGGDGTEGSGYHVLAISPRWGGWHYSWYGECRDWIREHLAAAAAEDPAKPIFMLTHHAFPNTVWNSKEGGSWAGQFGDDPDDIHGYDMAFYQELCAQYPQLIHFSGHTHIPMADPRSIYQAQDGFTLVQTATFANNFWMGEKGEGYDETGDDGAHPEAGQDASQCNLVEIDPSTNAVSIYRVDFREGTTIGEPWVVIPSEGTAGFRYTTAAMKEASKPPIVEGAELSVPEDSITATGASFSLTADKILPDTTGLVDDVVIAYRAEVRAADDQTIAYMGMFMSDYYKASANRQAQFVRPLFGAELAADTEYVLSVYALDPFDKESLVGEVAFRTAAE